MNDLHAREAVKIMEKNLWKPLMKSIKIAAENGDDYIYTKYLPNYAENRLRDLGYKVELTPSGQHWTIRWI